MNIFLNKLKKRNFFFKLLDAEKLTVPIVDVGNGFKAIVFYTEPDDSMVPGQYAGIPWEHGLDMVLNMEGTDGVVIQSTLNAWIAIPKSKFSEILAL